MNRFLFAFIGALLFSQSGFSQGYEYCNEVVGTTGFATSKGGLQFTWTVGEPVITTLKSGAAQLSLTQGFHQPEFCKTTTGTSGHLLLEDFSLYPNPAVSATNIEWSNPLLSTLYLRVFNNTGSLMEEREIFPGIQLLCGHWPPGSYILQFIDPRTGKTTAQTLIRSSE